MNVFLAVSGSFVYSFIKIGRYHIKAQGTQTTFVTSHGKANIMLWFSLQELSAPYWPETNIYTRETKDLAIRDNVSVVRCHLGRPRRGRTIASTRSYCVPHTERKDSLRMFKAT